MKLNKGKIIYLFLTVLLVALMLLPNATSLIRMEFSTLHRIEDYTQLIPDILSLLILFIGYFILKLIYKRHVVYIKIYPVYVLSIILFWTVMVQVRS